jgi:hypothetical protein
VYLSSGGNEVRLDEHFCRKLVGPHDAAPLRYHVLNHLPDLDRAVLKTKKIVKVLPYNFVILFFFSFWWEFGPG